MENYEHVIKIHQLRLALRVAHKEKEKIILPKRLEDEKTYQIKKLKIKVTLGQSHTKITNIHNRSKQSKL